MSEITVERVAKNDAAFRAANEQIRDLADQYGPPERVPFVCECANPECTEVVQLTLPEYEAIRASPRYFLSVPGHEGDEDAATAVVREAVGYVVVEKQGRAAEVVEELDPRKEN